MTLRVPGLAIALAASLAACATPAPSIYAPAGTSNRGYSETQIESDRFRIQFQAGSDMTIQTAEDMALRRAAEVTLLNDGEWFIVVNRSRDGNNRNPVDTRTSVGMSVGSGGYRSTGVGIGINVDRTAGEKTAGLEILVRRGPREDRPDAYDAAAVLSRYNGGY